MANSEDAAFISAHELIMPAEKNQPFSIFRLRWELSPSYLIRDIATSQINGGVLRRSADLRVATIPGREATLELAVR